MNDQQQPQTALVHDDRYLQHNAGLKQLPGHPGGLPFVEPEPHWSNHRLVQRTKHLVDLSGLGPKLAHVEPREAALEQVAWNHTLEYIERVRVICEAGGGEIDPGAPAGRDSYEVALLAAGGAMTAVDAVMAGEVRNAFALVRPPGHHALPDKGMGFCIFNNVAIAAHHARRNHGLERVLILDWDVHDGNGTQVAFYDDPNVVFISIHQDRLFPIDFGLLEQDGSGDGKGRTVNIPLPAGSGDATYLAAFDRIILPIIEEFQPQLLLISAGQDASTMDPLGRMCVTTGGYRQMTSMMMAAADKTGSRLAAIQEGGYSEVYAPYCTLAIIETLAGESTNLPEPMAPERIQAQPHHSQIGPSGEAALEAIQKHHAQYWDALR